MVRVDPSKTNVGNFTLRAQKAIAKMQKQITITNIEHRNALLIKKGENK